MGAAAEPLLDELGKPAFHEVEPSAVGRREARVTHSPAMNLGGLVRRGVVHDDVDVEVVGHAAVEEVQEPTELDRAVRRGEICDHVARRDVQLR